MKDKIIAFISLLIAMLCVAFSAFRIGVREGVRRVIEESRVYSDGHVVSIDFEGNVYDHYID